MTCRPSFLAEAEKGIQVKTIQHDGARKLLRIIVTAVKSNRLLTYKIAAKLLGRIPPERHSRAVAQMCDLLDAAATLAGGPLLALFQVRSNGGKINPKAWKEDEEFRNAIIEKSKRHHFTEEDFEAISLALNELNGLGNKSAWKYVYSRIPDAERRRRLASPDSTVNSDAIDDMGTDTDIGTDTPDRAKVSGTAYARDPKIRVAVMNRSKGKCEYCGNSGFKKPNGGRYLECHHIIALANEGKDRMTNVIALCPNDHREAHFGKRGDELENEMIEKVKIIQGRVKPSA